jgi:hypothetical protein
LDPGEHDTSDEPVQVASDGAGPLWQRDYFATIEGTEYAPEEVLKLLLREFPHFSPEIAAKFVRRGDPALPLQLGEELDIALKGYGPCAVRVVRIEPRSLTLRTIDGHLEAGRITFGAYRDEQSRLVFHIRSRSTINGPLRYLGYRLIGMPIQERIWVTFVERVAQAVGGQIVDKVHVESHKMRETASDRGEAQSPTFLATDRTGERK